MGGSLPGIRDGEIAWGDADQDGDLDVALAGEAAGAVLLAGLYRNDGGMFVEVLSVVGRELGSADWCDADGDGDLDAFFTGYDGAVPVTTLLRNDGGWSFVDTGVALPGVYESDAAWGDADNDGDLDLALAGRVGGGTRTATLYRNDGGLAFAALAAGLPGIRLASMDWGDQDNDGDLDLILAGQTSTFGISLPLTFVYRNDGMVLVPIWGATTQVAGGEVQWGDLDGDGTLDLAVAGPGFIGTASVDIYLNNFGVENLAPFPPSGLSVNVLPGDSLAVFSWSPGSDAATPPDGLTYALRVGSLPGAADRVTPYALASGVRLVSEPGNVGHNLSWTVAVEEGHGYSWSVQTVDSGQRGSPFAGEETFSVGSVLGSAPGPLPQKTALLGVFPNPSPSPRLRFALPASESVRFEVYDAQGRLVAMPLDGDSFEAGVHEVGWSGRDDQGRKVGEGVYFYRFIAGAFRETGRLVLLN